MNCKYLLEKAAVSLRAFLILSLPTLFVWACPAHKAVVALHAGALILTKSESNNNHRIISIL